MIVKNKHVLLIVYLIIEERFLPATIPWCRLLIAIYFFNLSDMLLRRGRVMLESLVSLFRSC